MPDASASAARARSVLRANAAEWLGVVGRRCSRRAYDGVPADPGMLGGIERLLEVWRPYPDARVALVAKPAVDVFTGLVGSYGKVSYAPHVLVFIAEHAEDFADQHLGYTGEATVLEATRLGLATCWVSGFFNAKKAADLVELAPGERVLAVSPLGFALAENTVSERTLTALAGGHHRKPVTDIAPGATGGQWPEWSIAAVETARLAPSASNRQPWRFRMEDGGLVLAKDNFVETPVSTKRLDIGIAMLHVDLAAMAHRVEGVWTDLSGRDVARFDPVVAPG